MGTQKEYKMRYSIDNSALQKEVEKYFSIEEWVDRRTFQAYGEKSWRFFDRRLLATMLFIREEVAKPIIVNNWSRGGRFEQRGLRTNMSPLVTGYTRKQRLYLSAHMRGAAVDFDVVGMTAEEVRNWLQEHANHLPYKIRLESLMRGTPISWVHLDVDDSPENPKVYLFNV